MYVYRYGDYLKQRHTKRSLEMKLDVEDAVAEEKSMIMRLSMSQRWHKSRSRNLTQVQN